jgi:hypothetical protein
VFDPRSEENQSISDVSASAASHMALWEDVFSFDPMNHPLWNYSWDE